jgi:threonine dehydratase
VRVSEDDIRGAMRCVYERLKLVIEPSAAVGVAAALGAEVRAMTGLERIGIVLCGGNIDMTLLAQLMCPQ